MHGDGWQDGRASGRAPGAGRFGAFGRPVAAEVSGLDREVGGSELVVGRGRAAQPGWFGVVVFACVRGDDVGRVRDSGHPAVRVHGRHMGVAPVGPVEGDGHVDGRRYEAHAGLGLLRPVGLNY